jgi:hypothetical protein
VVGVVELGPGGHAGARFFEQNSGCRQRGGA